MDTFSTIQIVTSYRGITIRVDGQEVAEFSIRGPRKADEMARAISKTLHIIGRSNDIQRLTLAELRREEVEYNSL